MSKPMDKVERLARFLCKENDVDPNLVGPYRGSRDWGRVRLDAGEVAWTQYVPEAKAIIDLLAEGE